MLFGVESFGCVEVDVEGSFFEEGGWGGVEAAGRFLISHRIIQYYRILLFQ